MDIIRRNFLRLLRSGAFGEYEPIEPMSAFKWRRLINMSIQQSVLDTLAAGIRNHQYEHTANIPQDVKEEILHSAAYRTVQTAQTKGENANETRSESSLSNIFLRRRLRRIRDNERHAIDTSVETLRLLNLIVYATRRILTYGIYYCDILPIGTLLRGKGYRVDFVKLDTWIAKLQLQDMARFVGSILVGTLGFEIDEIPFAGNIDRNAVQRALAALQTKDDNSAEWHIQEGVAGLIYNDNGAVRKTVWHSLPYIPYAPIETVSCIIARCAHVLSEIEE